MGSALKGKRLLCFGLSAFLWSSLALAADLGTDAQKTAGKELYTKYCVQCHGEQGDGNGVAAPYFKPLPRDFTQGKYKIRMTASGELPTDQDIFRAIKHGLAFKSTGAYTVMPPWPNLSDEQIMNLVYYLKTFSSDFTDPDYNNPKTITITQPIPSSEESIKKGRTVYENNECVKCHGDKGRGNGRSAPTLEDDWEQHIRPADLTKRWTFRGGSSPEDIFRTISTGFNGTPMPAYADNISAEDRWHLINYIYSFSPLNEPEYSQPDDPIHIYPTNEKIDLTDIGKAELLFADLEVARIPIVAQVIEPGRSFAPGVNQLNVKAIYNDEDIAILIQWHDMTADTSGATTPDMNVPRFEPAVETEEGDPFADEEEEEADDPFAEEEEEEGFADAVALQIPTEREAGFAKPYFLLGDSSRPVHLWYTSLAEGKSTELYSANGSSSLKPLADESLASVSRYDDGKWTVIMKRARKVENGISFVAEKSFVPVGFSVWDGFAKDRGSQRGITSWFYLYQEPMEKPSVWGPVVRNVLVFLLLELLLVFVVRRRKTRKP